MPKSHRIVLPRGQLQPGDRALWHRQRGKQKKMTLVCTVREIRQSNSYIFAVVTVEPDGWLAQPSIHRLERIEESKAAEVASVRVANCGRPRHEMIAPSQNGLPENGHAALTLWAAPSEPTPKPDPHEVKDILTDREIEILSLVAQGLGNDAIAEKLVISERTVRTHVSNIFSKVNVENRTQATLIALDCGLSHGLVPKRYRHRNGEHDPPTEAGGFWVEIPEPLQRDYILIAKAPWGEWRMRRSNGEWEPYLPHRLRMEKMRFWGPEVPPWGE